MVEASTVLGASRVSLLGPPSHGILDSEKRRVKPQDELPVPNTRQHKHQHRHLSIIRFSKLWVLLFLTGAWILWRNVSQGNLEVFGSLPRYRFPHWFPHPVMSTEEKENLFLSVPNEVSAVATSRVWATRPHIAGSPEDFDSAKDMLRAFQENFNIRTPYEHPIYEAGSEASQEAIHSLTSTHHFLHSRPTAWIDVYYPIINYPTRSTLEILGDDGKPVWTADLSEDGDPLDPEAAKYRNTIPAFHGYSANGDATGELAYVNYGTKEDYDELVASGVDLKGKIALARYGKIFRGLKIKGAGELGAIGVLIYSDVRDDGKVTVANGYAPYPAGPARNPTSVQRGSAQYLSVYPGDPTTPGFPSYENATRVDAGNVPTIPSLPISWNNAERLLEEISEGSGGQLVVGGTSKSKIRMVNEVDIKVRKIWNTMAAIPGHIRDEVVIVGCHRDAWVMGAADPTSGTVSLHEIIRAFGQLIKHGWKPLRTVVFASWDAEEYGLVGSTEWGEDFAEWIKENVVSYLNTDVSVKGSRWTPSSSPSLAHLIRQTALDVPHPTIPGKTMWDAREDEGPFTGNVVDPSYLESYNAKLESERRAYKTGVRPLGSGSDYTVFLQRLGVASLDEGFAFTPTDAVYHYHSIYDSQRWQEIYSDVGFHRHVAVAKHLGLMALRLVDSYVLPLNTTQYALELDNYLDVVEDLAPRVEPSLVNSQSFSSLRNSITKLQEASAKLDEEKQAADKEFRKILRRIHHWKGHEKCGRRRFGGVRAWIKSVFGVRSEPMNKDSSTESFPNGRPHPPHHLPRLPIHKLREAAMRLHVANRKLIAFERGFISEGGIKDREWYKHLVVAPGKWLGYGATTLPALTEAITIDRNATAALEEADRLTDLFDKLAEKIKI